jgi:hypothetical protein
LEAEDESVKPAENNCDWCGKPCRSEKYCCNKCKHEHAKVQHTLPNITKNAVVSVRQRLRVDTDLRVAFLIICVVWLIFQGLNLWLIRVNDIYMVIMDRLPQLVLQSPETVIPRNISRVLAFVLRLIFGSYLMTIGEWEHGIVSLLIVCLLSTAVIFWFGQFSFVANCVVLLVGVGCMVLLPLLPPKHK